LEVFTDIFQGVTPIKTFLITMIIYFPKNDFFTAFKLLKMQRGF